MPANETVVFLGDSLTAQLHQSWCSRLLNDSVLDESSSGLQQGASWNSFQHGATWTYACACTRRRGGAPRMLGLLTYFWDLCSTGTEYSGS